MKCFSFFPRNFLLILSGVTLLFTPHGDILAHDSPIALVSKEMPLSTVVIAEDAPPLTQESAERLVYYLKEISNVHLQITNDPKGVKTPGIIWVGPHPALATQHPEKSFSVTEPEETLIQTSGQDLIILGRDTLDEKGQQLEAGTHLAVTSFIEEHLGVRWLWPGALGIDIPKRSEVVIQPISSRYTPQLRVRQIGLARFEHTYKRSRNETLRKRLAKLVDNPEEWAKARDREVRKWINNQRADTPLPRGSNIPQPLAGSWGASFHGGHGFLGWYEEFGQTNPEFFAMQPDGTRTPFPFKRYGKLCPSNPELAEQWVAKAKEYLKQNPDAIEYSASENDYGWQGYCVCEECLAMDNKEGEILEQPIRWKNKTSPFYALTNRYAQFWNKLAKELKKAFPEREVFLSTYAYHVTRPAPTIPLEKNILVSFVGIERRFYSRNGRKHTLEQREIWRKWWEAVGKRNMLVWRPNILYRTLGLPYVFTRRHAETMRFLARHGLVGIDFDSGGHWATQGPQLYLNAKLAWNPEGDARKILSDYYERAFGPAAESIAAYFDLFEKLYGKLGDQYQSQRYNSLIDPPRLFREVRLDNREATRPLGREGVPKHRQIEKRAEELLQKAESLTQDSEPIYRERVAFVRSGFNYIQAQLDCIEAMTRFSGEPTKEHRQQAIAAAKRRTQILDSQLESLAINYFELVPQLEQYQEQLGPPPEDEAGNSSRTIMEEEQQQL